MLPKKVALLTVKWSQFMVERPHVGNRKAAPLFDETLQIVIYIKSFTALSLGAGMAPFALLDYSSSSSSSSCPSSWTLSRQCISREMLSLKSGTSPLRNIISGAPLPPWNLISGVPLPPGI